MLWIIIGIIVTLGLSAMFSGTEIAFISAGKLNVEIRKNRGSRKGRLISDFFESPNKFLSTMLVGNNITLVFFTALMEMALQPSIDPFVRDYAPTWIPKIILETLPLTIITTIVVLIFGEFLPKIFFRLFADKVLFWLAYPIAAFKILLTPISWMMVQLSDRLIRLFVKAPPEDTDGVFTRLDLEKFVESTSGGKSEDDILNTEMFSNVLHLKRTRVRDCMIPRTEIEAVEVTDSVEDLREVFVETNLSKIIVYRESIDDIVGYVHHQHLLDRPKNIRSVMRKIPVVPEAMRIHHLMNMFIRERMNIACVVDEFGGTSGIITLEDILEEIFGEIEDEHDVETGELQERISEREYRFSGRLEVDFLNENYANLHFPEGEYHTLSGYIVMTLGRIPMQGERLEMDGYLITAEMVSDTKVETAKVYCLTDDRDG